MRTKVHEDLCVHAAAQILPDSITVTRIAHGHIGTAGSLAFIGAGDRNRTLVISLGSCYGDYKVVSAATL